MRKPRTTVRDYLDRETHYNDAVAALAFASRSKLRDTVTPLAVPMPTAVSLTPLDESGHITALLYGDTHFPYQDDRALAIVGRIAEVLSPSVIVHMGDLLDCYALSRFDKDPNVLGSLQEEIDAARAHLAVMRLRSPKSRFVLLEGNHENRLTRVLWGLQGESRTLAKLNVVRQSVTWPVLLGLDEMGVEFHAYDQQPISGILPHFALKHGTLVRKESGYSARAEMEHHGESGASGHTHRFGLYQKTSDRQRVWVETGCTCSLTPTYTPRPNWQQACVILTMREDGTVLNVEPVLIHEGKAIWRGNMLMYRD